MTSPITEETTQLTPNPKVQGHSTPCVGIHLLLSLRPGTGTRLAAHSKPQARPVLSSSWTTDLPYTQLHTGTAKTQGQKPGFLSTMPKSSRTKLLALPGMFPEKRLSGEEATLLQPPREEGRQQRLCTSHCLSSNMGSSRRGSNFI